MDQKNIKIAYCLHIFLGAAIQPLWANGRYSSMSLAQGLCMLSLIWQIPCSGIHAATLKSFLGAGLFDLSRLPGSGSWKDK